MKVVRALARLRVATLLALLGSLALVAGPALRAAQPPSPSGVKADAQSNLLTLPEEKPGKGMTWPALSPDGKMLCFAWLGDLWTVPTSGGVASRLTLHEAMDYSPRWSPDGKWIAFTSTRTGNPDIFLIPATGGEARQVTYYANSDIVTDWSADGTKLLFYSVRDTRGFALFSIDLKTRGIKQLATDEDNLRSGTWSPDGKSVAFYRSGEPWWRPWYRGSYASRVVVKDFATNTLHTPLKTNTQQLWPLWSGDGKSVYITTIYGNGANTPNLWRVPASGGTPTQITKYTTDAVRYPNIARNGSLLAYMYNGNIYTCKADGSDAKPVPILLRTDDKINFQERQVLTQGAEDTQLSPDGKQIALSLRGNLWLIPSQGGDAQRLTDAEGNYNDIAWSPDSTKLVLISDRGNQTDVYTMDVKTKALTRITNDAESENDTSWSPDGKFIGFLKAGKQPGLYVAPADGSGPPRRILEGSGNSIKNGNYIVMGINSFAWSSDSKWVAVARSDRYQNQDIWVVPTVGGAAINVTRFPGTGFDARLGGAPGGNFGPQFTRDGRHLLFITRRNGPPELYKLPLETPEDLPIEIQQGNAPQGARPPDRSKDVKIDFEDIHLRAVAVPGITNFDGFTPMPDGQRILVHTNGIFVIYSLNGGPGFQLSATPEGAGNVHFTPDNSRIFFTGGGGVPRTLSLMPQPPQQSVAINYSAEYLFDRRRLNLQALNEFYRRFGEGFYDPNMHGVDWKALRAKYEALLPSIGTDDEFATILSMMVGEVNSSHSEIQAPPRTASGPTQPTLGLFYDMDYSGPGLKVTSVMPKSPGDKPATRINPGEYVLSIDGTNVSMNEDYYRTIQNKENKTVELLVNSKPSKEGARTVKIRPIPFSTWAFLEEDARMRRNAALVEKLSGGRLGYVHLANMLPDPFKQFERVYMGDLMDKEGMILDIRDNGGGISALGNAIQNLLLQKNYVVRRPRDGEARTQPEHIWNRPVVLMINERSSSAAEVFPYEFRAMHLGKIVGTPTHGYLIGTQEGTLINGTRFRIPGEGVYGLDGTNLENYGVPPDILVENTPQDIAQGYDRQLAVAVATALKDLPSESPGGNGGSINFQSANDNPNGGSSAVTPPHGK